MTHKIPSPEGTKRLRASVFFMSYCPSVHVLTSIASVANALYIIKLLYNSTVSMVMDAIYDIQHTPMHLLDCISLSDTAMRIIWQ